MNRLCLLVLLLFTPAAFGDSIVPTKVHCTLPPGHEQSVCWITFFDVTRQTPPIPMALRPGEVRSVELPAGVWTISSQVPGLWSPERAATPGTDTTLTFMPTIVTTGRVRPPHGTKGKLPSSVTIEILRSSVSEIPSGAGIRCPVGPGGELRCETPVGIHDIRIRPEGNFVPFYRWDVRFSGSKDIDLGVFDLKTGASISGSVSNGTKDTEIAIKPFLLPGDEPRPHAPLRIVRPDTRQFFSIGGVPEGKWIIEARSPGFAVTRIGPIVVREGSETRMSRPIELLKAGAMELAITPPISPAQEKWLVTLQPLPADGVVPPPGALFSGTASIAGTLTVADLYPGTYRLLLCDSDRNRYAEETVTILSGQPRFQSVTVNLIRVEGSVMMDGAPVAAEITFGGNMGLLRTSSTSSAEGEFTAFIPAAGRWRVDVTPETTKRTVTLRTTVTPNEDGRAHVTLNIPTSSIHGVVVTGQNATVPNAEVYFDSPTQSARATTDNQGRFAISGLERTRGRIVAVRDEGHHHQSSSSVEITPDNESARDARLVLKPSREVRGRIYSAVRQVNTAQVFVWPDGGEPTEVETEVDGSFATEVDAGAKTAVVIVRPTGFGLTAARTTLDSDVAIAVGPPSGILRVLIPGKPAVMRNLPLFDVRQNGVSIPLQILHSWALGMGSTFLQEGVITVPGLPPGRYDVCEGTGASAKCASGNLAEGMTVEIEIPTGSQ